MQVYLLNEIYVDTFKSMTGKSSAGKFAVWKLRRLGIWPWRIFGVWKYCRAEISLRIIFAAAAICALRFFPR